jgi:Flp pilus assembly protein TadG
MPGIWIRNWLKNREGVTAIEFSLMAAPFLLIIIGIIELSLLYVANSLLLGGVDDVARQIRTGQLQTATDPRQAFHDAFCKTSGVLIDCDKIQYEVQTIASFASADLSPPGTNDFDEHGNFKDPPPFEPGASGSLVMIRVLYFYPLVTPLIGQFFADYPGNNKLMIATIVVENEPYPTQ